MLKLYTPEKNFPLSFLVLANHELFLTPNSNQFIVVDEMAGPEVSFIQMLRCMLPNAHMYTHRNPPLEDDSIIRAGCLGTRGGVLMSMPMQLLQYLWGRSP